MRCIHMLVKKNYCWIWIAVDRFGKRFISFVCADRSTQTGLKLWNNLKDKEISLFCSDHWKSYSEFIPPEKHIQSKAETFTLEGYNSGIRHYLARFKPKGKCYSKAEYMIQVEILGFLRSLKLLFLKLNGITGFSMITCQIYQGRIIFVIINHSTWKQVQIF